MNELETMIEKLRADGFRHSKDDSIPDTIRPYILPLNWDNKKIWALDLPTDYAKLSDFTWLTELPWWGGIDGSDGRSPWFKVSPLEVIRYPNAYPIHMDRIDNADVSYPIHAIRRNGKSVIVDGVHRLCAQYMAGEEWVKVKWLKAEHLPLIVTTGPPGF